MRAFEILLEDTTNTTPGVNDYIVIYGGRFQPPHSGHYAIYNYLTKLFNPNKVLISTSNKTDIELLNKFKKNLEDYKIRYNSWLEKKTKAEEKGNKIPLEPKKPSETPPELKSFFNFEEKKLIWTKMFGVSSDKIQYSAVPAFQPKEILSTMDEKTAFIAVTSEKDNERYTVSSFFEPYPIEGGKPVPFENIKDKLYPWSEKGYYIILPQMEGGISASKVRNTFMDSDKSEDEKKNFFKTIYKKYDEEIYNLINNKLGIK
jgi:hypothetical protein